jgi:hypothetical protein
VQRRKFDGDVLDLEQNHQLRVLSPSWRSHDVTAHATACSNVRVSCTKGGQKTVPRRLDHIAQMRLNDAPQDRIMSGDTHLHRPGMLLPKLRAALNIGEKESAIPVDRSSTARLLYHRAE